MALSASSWLVNVAKPQPVFQRAAAGAASTFFVKTVAQLLFARHFAYPCESHCFCRAKW